MFLVAPPGVATANYISAWISFFLNEFLPSVISALSSMKLDVGVSMFAFLIAVALLCIVIGGILIR